MTTLITRRTTTAPAEDKTSRVGSTPAVGKTSRIGTTPAADATTRLPAGTQLQEPVET